jgi:hypothetical protein
MRFTFWSIDYSAPFVIPTNTYRIRTDRLDTNLDTLNMFDATATTSTNFTYSVSGAETPRAGYYIGGLNSFMPNVGSSRNFDGDIAELICYQGYLSETDRLAVTSYLQQKYYQSGGSGSISYQWQFDGTNIAGATNFTLTFTNIQPANSGTYTVLVGNSFGITVSSNAVVEAGYPPVIAAPPANQVAVADTTVTFSGTATGSAPFTYQWQFDGANIPGATNTFLTVVNAQPSNSGAYAFVASNPFGLAVSSNATLTVELPPIITTQPRSQTMSTGSNVTFSVTAATTTPSLPAVGSGTLQLWLKVDAGVITNGTGLVSQWQDQSGNTNGASQNNTNLQPMLVSAPGINGNAAVRFNGVQNNVNGSYLHGTGLVNVPNAMTDFTVYDAFSTTNSENAVWDMGVPGMEAVSRGDMITGGDMRFTFWSIDYSAPFIVPTNTYRIRTDRLDTNLDTLNMFDATANTATNFTVAVSGANTPGAGYYIGGLDTSLPFVGTSRNFNGDVAELICYQGYLNETDRLAVTGYLLQKYFQVGGNGNLTYQWQYRGTNIAGATNSSLTLTNVQLTNFGFYSVIVSNGVAFTVSSNAFLTVDGAPVILSQPCDRTVLAGEGASFGVTVAGYPRPAYQWQVNGLNIAGGTNAILAIASVAPTDGGNYNVVVSNSMGTATSSSAVLAVDYLVATGEGQAQQIATSNLTVPSTVQPQNSFAVSSVDSVSLQGGLLQWTNGVIGYIPPAGFTGEDMFDYVLTPGAGSNITGIISVLVDACRVTSGCVNGGKATLRFVGLPEVTYTIEVSSDLITWVPIGSVAAGTDGHFEFQDPNAGRFTTRFYRTSLPQNVPCPTAESQCPKAMGCQNGARKVDFDARQVGRNA